MSYLTARSKLRIMFGMTMNGPINERTETCIWSEVTNLLPRRTRCISYSVADAELNPSWDAWIPRDFVLKLWKLVEKGTAMTPCVDCHNCTLSVGHLEPNVVGVLKLLRQKRRLYKLHSYPNPNSWCEQAHEENATNCTPPWALVLKHRTHGKDVTNSLWKSYIHPHHGKLHDPASTSFHV